MVEPVLPTGTVTFLFTDVEGSTRLWEEHPDAMRPALAEHDELIRSAVEAHAGHVVKTTGDGVHAAFATADDAIRAAIAAQRALAAHEWGETGELRVRMGLHTGTAEVRDGDYYGSSLNRAARLMAVANGGQIVCSHATADLAWDSMAEGVVLTDLGEHRLRDLSRREQVFQVHASDLTATFAPLQSLDAFPGNLPLQVSSFVGREREVVQFAAALGEARVVTLTGVGGVGKTRLALQVAAEVLPGFREGAWLVELAPVRDEDGVVELVASTFGVTPRAGASPVDSLVEFLRSKQLLLVLDNCEHVLEAAGDLVERIEQSCAGVVVLTTSREPLAIEGERVLGLRSLGTPEEDASPEVAARSEAVRLFVERAQFHDREFELSSANTAAVVQVCRRLDGVPLAIELAAGRVTTMNPAELASALERRLDALSGARRRAVKRHQTLRATIDWSYDLLTDDERRLLARLSVFAGGCTREAVEHVCGTAPLRDRAAFEVLSSLVARSLAVAERDGPETTYRLLETIREYGEERLAEHDEVTPMRDRHLDYYANFAERYAAQVWGPDQLTWANRLQAQRDDVLAAWSWAIDTSNLAAARRLLQCADVVHQVGYQLRLPGEALVATPDADEHPVILAGIAARAGLAGDYASAATLGAQARHADVDSDPKVERFLALSEGIVATARSDATRAAVEWEHAVDAGRRAGVPTAQIAMDLAFAAIAWASADEPEHAIVLAEEALTLARVSGMPSALSMALLSLGMSVVGVDPERARRYLDEGLEVGASLGYEQSAELQVATFLASRLRDRRRTLELAARTVRHTQWTGDRTLLMLMLGLAAGAIARARPEAAVRMRDAVVAIQRSAHVGVDAGHAAPFDVEEVATFAVAEIAAALADPEFG